MDQSQGEAVIIYPKLQRKLEQLWRCYPDIRKDGDDFEGQVNNMLETAADIEAFSREKTMPLHVVAVLNRIIILGDIKAGKLVYIEFVDEGVGLNCQEHQSQNCVHVGYCLAIPRIYRRILEKETPGDI